MFGATGAVGKLFKAQALEAEHDLTVLVRDKRKLEPSEHPRVKVIEGDATDLADVTRVVERADVTVSCLGNTRGAKIMAKSFDNILTAASAQPTVPRFIAITSLGCGGSSCLMRIVVTLIVGRASFADYERADDRVRSETAVRCTLVRPTALNDRPGTGKYKATGGKMGLLARPLSNSDLATFLVEAVSDDRWDGTGGVQICGTKWL